MAFAIKAEIDDTQAGTFVFTAPKTMYGGKRIAEGDVIFMFASENEAARASSRAASSLPPRRSRRGRASHGRRRA